jgi:hypothetical protein
MASNTLHFIDRMTASVILKFSILLWHMSTSMVPADKEKIIGGFTGKFFLIGEI